LATKHGLDDNRRCPDENHVDVQAVLFVKAGLLGDPPGQAGAADGSKGKGYFGGRLRRKIGHSEKEKEGEEKGQWVSFHKISPIEFCRAGLKPALQLVRASNAIDDSFRIIGRRISTPRHVAVGAHQNQGTLIDVPHPRLIESDHSERQTGFSRGGGESRGVDLFRRKDQQREALTE
jgi:hypothetical protein